MDTSGERAARQISSEEKGNVTERANVSYHKSTIDENTSIAPPLQTLDRKLSTVHPNPP